MTSKHTPGPWVANANHPARSNDSEIVIEQEGGSPPIATCYAINTLGFGSPQVLANARLIAAAPDLLAALEEACNQLVTLRSYIIDRGYRISNERTNMTSASLLIAEKAIAKAKGE